MTSASAVSWLFVPGSRSDRFEKAARSAADEIILDLEDAVEPSGKASARLAVAAWLESRDGWVRINASDTDWFEDDIEAVASARGLRGVVVPKCEDLDVLDRLSSLLGERRVVPLIETCVGLDRIRELTKRLGVLRLAFGSLDFAADLGAIDEDVSLLFARSELVLASRLAGLSAPIDGVTTSLREPEAVAAAAKRSRALGFGGKLCVHPEQVAPVREAFQPNAEEVAWAHRIITASRVAESGAVSVDGQMVDRPVIERARRILDR